MAAKKKLSLEYRPRAAFDIESIVLYVGEVLKSPKAAKGIYEDICLKVGELCEMPSVGKIFRDDLLGREYRYALVKSYRIFYSYDSSKLTFWRVVHTRQDIDDFALVGWDE